MLTVYIPGKVLDLILHGERSQRLEALLQDATAALAHRLVRALLARSASNLHDDDKDKTSLYLSTQAETKLRTICSVYGLTPSLVVSLLIEGSAVN